MSPDEIEDRIQALNTDIARLQFMRDATSNVNLAYGYRIRQQRLAKEVRRLVAMRSPETVRRMERERGLA